MSASTNFNNLIGLHAKVLECEVTAWSRYDYEAVTTVDEAPHDHDSELPDGNVCSVGEIGMSIPVPDGPLKMPVVLYVKAGRT